ncbi:SusC/RagA family TonB-linked outer membrane protein [Parapedobacter soli]|uniref:SusC/RagA family TonB-linked outer membrane protein n=1 Tax=Parapedobacter soli TaxID=416955 RepID=UPI0021C927EE|nr:SusC/RagA family TonB-linked outer membrane protein [Parapedobacter soli]
MKNKLLFKVMRLLVLFWMVSLFHVSAATYSQTVTLKGKSLELAEVFNAVRNQTGLGVYGFQSIFEGTRPVTVDVKAMPVNQFLQLILVSQPLEARVENGAIVIKRKEGKDYPIVRNHIIEVVQQRMVTGRVTDEQGNPLEGVTVRVEGTNVATTTNIDGRYEINMPEDGNILTFNILGYKATEASAVSQSTINISLKTVVSDLDEVVVVGYGTQKREHITTAISSVKEKDFAKGANQDAAQLIRGKVAGLAVVTPDGNPLNVSQIKLRGNTTINGNTSPLILIDGIPGSLITVSPDDIESIDVLKDGAAAAIYGTRGTNGVVLITTRKVNGEMQPSIDVNSYITTQRLSTRVEMFSPDEYRQLVSQGKPGAFDFGASTDWLDEVIQTPFSQVHNVSLKGGMRNTNYIASFEYRNLNGIMRKSNNVMTYPRLEINHSMFDNKLKFNVNILGYQQKNFAFDGNQYSGMIYRNAISFNPTSPLKTDDGRWFEQPEKPDYRNPVAWLDESVGLTKNSSWQNSGSLVFNPTTDLQLKGVYSSQVFSHSIGYYETKDLWWTPREGYASRGSYRSQDNLFELTADYRKVISDHELTVLGGYTWRYLNTENYWMQNWNFPSDDFLYNNMGAGLALRDGQANLYSYQGDSKLIGYFARMNYSYKSRYLLMASIRYEGSSRFGKNHKWGSFPAISVGWNLHNEPFFTNEPSINQLKLRASYGITGTEPNGSYISLSRINFNTNALVDGEWIQAINPSNNPNPDLRWETKKEFNAGFDYGFFDNRITGSFDYYIRTTNDLIADFPVPTPPYLYSSITSNAASMRNKGLEIQLNVVPVRKGDFEWQSSVNYYINANKVLALSNDKFSIASGYFDTGHTGEPMQQTTHRVQVGQPLGNFFGYKTIDVDDDGYWVIEDSEGNPKSNLDQSPADKKIIGNGIPKHYLNWNNTLTYKNLDLSIVMRGAFGFQILNMTEMFWRVPVFLTRGNLRSNAYDDVYGKRPLADDQSLQYVSYFLEDGDYWKIDNVTIGYNFSLNAGKYLKRARIYSSANNLYTITGYKGIDPEVNINGLAPGVDPHNRYPSTTSYTLGVNLNF